MSLFYKVILDKIYFLLTLDFKYVLYFSMNTKKTINKLCFWSYLKRQEFCKKHNIFQDNKEILEILMAEESVLEWNTNLKYNNFFFKQHINNWFSPKDLIIDDIDQITYHHKPENKYIVEMMLDYFDSNLILSENYEKQITNIIEKIQKKENVFVITNHTTFANIPIIISTIEKQAKKMKIDNINDSIITVLWPAIMTQRQKNVIQWMSHIYKTHPKTINWIIPWLEQKQLRKSWEFWIKILEQCKEKWGNIIFIAPTATRDTIERLSKDDNKIFFWDDSTESVNATLHNLIQRTISIKDEKDTRKEKNNIVLIWVNDSQLKNPSYVNPTNNEWKKSSDIYLCIKNYKQEEISKLIEEKKLMSELANLVIDKTGESIAEAISIEKLNQIKEELRTNKFSK